MTISKRSLKYGSLSIGITVAVIAALVLINVVAILLVERFPLKLDLTEEKLFELAPESIDYLKKVDEKVEIILCGAESVYDSFDSYAKTVEMIKNYSKYNSLVAVSFVDVEKTPSFKSQYPDEANDITANTIIVQSEKRYRVLSLYDLLDIQQDYYGSVEIVASNAEQELSSAIDYVLSDDTYKIQYTAGHNETAITEFTDLLKTNNFVSSPVTLIQDDIDKDTRILIIAAPTRDFDEEEIKKIEDFLINDEKYGKHLMVFTSPAMPQLPNLEAFLAEWGMRPKAGHLIDSESRAPSLLFLQYTDTELAGNLDTKGIPFAANSAQPVETLFESSGYTNVSTLLSTYDNIYLIDKLPERWTQESMSEAIKNGKAGKYDILVRATKTIDENTSSVVVCGNTELLGTSSFMSGILSSSAYGNGTYMLNLMNKTVDKKDAFNFIPRSLKTASLGITAKTFNALFVLFVFVLPLAVVIAGISVWLSRRHL